MLEACPIFSLVAPPPSFSALYKAAHSKKRQNNGNKAEQERLSEKCFIGFSEESSLRTVRLLD
jgi:hypothetical protein